MPPGAKKTMVSILRIQASRANGAKSHGPVTEEGKRAAAANSAHSTGPVTPEGKSISARNATGHGMLAGAVVLEEPEDCEHFMELLEEMYEELRPETRTECDMVDAAVVAQWRRMRAWCIEKMQFTHAAQLRRATDPDAASDSPAMATSKAFTDLSDKSHAFAHLNRYQARYSREYKSAIAFIDSRRAARDAALRLRQLRSA